MKATPEQVRLIVALIKEHGKFNGLTLRYLEAVGAIENSCSIDWTAKPQEVAMELLYQATNVDDLIKELKDINAS